MIGENEPKPPPAGNASFVPPRGAQAELHIDGRHVGQIEVVGWHSTYTHGRFTPGEAFAPYAALFGRWSLLMHEDETRPLHATASSALAEAERDIDTLHVRIYFPKQDRWVDVRQVNIDGDLVEWKDF